MCSSDLLRENMARLGLNVRVQVADVLEIEETEAFDAVLLDAPCSATGTIARHPEMKYHRAPEDVERLAEVQEALLKKAIRLVKTGGEIVFATCSLQPQEGDRVIRSVSDLVEVIRPADKRWQGFITPLGSLRILPGDGMDGFYVCLMRKK